MLRALYLTLPRTALLVLVAACLAAIRLVRAILIPLPGPAFPPVTIASSEGICILFSACIAMLMLPVLPEFDLRRTRARWLALSRFCFGGAIVASVAAFAAWQHTLAYFAALPEATRVPESELIINNALFIYAMTCILSPFVSAGIAAASSVLFWVAGLAPVLFIENINLWPLDYFQGPGPWVSLPHIVTTATLLVAAGAVHFSTAGEA